MKICNFTPHSFTFYPLSACFTDPKSKKLILAAGTAPLFTVYPEEMELRCETEMTDAPAVQIGQHSIAQTEITVVSCDPLPELADGEIAIVSLLYMNTAKAKGWDCSKLRTAVLCYLDAASAPKGVVKLCM